MKIKDLTRSYNKRTTTVIGGLGGYRGDRD